MKRILLIVFLAIFAIVAGAVADQTVTFQWDDTNNPAPDGYRLFIRDQSADYTYNEPTWEGTGTIYAITLPDGNYAAVVRAYNSSSESANSNEVLFQISPQPPALTVPGRPQQLIINFE